MAYQASEKYQYQTMEKVAVAHPQNNLLKIVDKNTICYDDPVFPSTSLNERVKFYTKEELQTLQKFHENAIDSFVKHPLQLVTQFHNFNPRASEFFVRACHAELENRKFSEGKLRGFLSWFICKKF